MKPITPNGTTTTFAIIAMILTPIHISNAAKKTPPDEGLVTVSVNNFATSAGFITTINGTAVVICPAKTFSAETGILDKDANKIEYAAILVPKDPFLKRFFIFLEIDGDAKTPKLELEKHDSGNTYENTPVWTAFLAKAKRKRIKTNGKIKHSDGHFLLLDIKTKVKSNFTGAPLISSESGKVLGALICSKTPQGFKADKALPLHDNMDFTKIQKDRIKKEMDVAKHLNDAIATCGATFLETNNLIKEHGLDKILDKKRKRNPFKNMSDDEKRSLEKQIKKLLEDLKENRRKLAESVKKSKAFGKLTVPSMELSQMQNIARAGEIANRKSKPQEELLQKILDKLQMAF